MYVSLTYPFNIVQHTLPHTVEHRKLDSLATVENIVWSTCPAHDVTNFIDFDWFRQLFRALFDLKLLIFKSL